LPNVVLTPHIAGVIEQNETATMGQVMLDELQRYLNDEPLKWEVTRERLKTMA
jgi:phosphoglycerate dehydrogenase-like enzyme